VFIFLRIIGILFFPLVMLYTLVIYLRNKFYDWSWLKSYSVDAPVISVGNIQMGGTGKTPLVQYLSKKLMDDGYSVVILSRGYRRKGKEGIIVEGDTKLEINLDIVGDEPYLLKQNLPGVTLGVDASRLRVAREILKLRNDVTFILDDGFQHRKLRRDIDIVLIDVSRWSRLPLLFPITSLRDVKYSLYHASCIILNGSIEEKQNITLNKFLVKKYNKPIFHARIEPQRFISLVDENEVNEEEVSKKKIFAFAGIGTPSSFLLTLKNINLNIVGKKYFFDHHDYKIKDLETVQGLANRFGANAWITTQKDAVKIRGLLKKWKPASNVEIFYLQTELIIREENEFVNLLKQYIIK
jgi:tetraacyldisaccharide 4'-kinase